jgi:adenylate cyclase
MGKIDAQFEVKNQPSNTGRSETSQMEQDYLPAEAPRMRAGLTIDDIAHPAYMLNYNLELTWYNEPARQQILRFVAVPPGTESRNIFRLLPNPADEQAACTRHALMRLYVSLAKPRVSKSALLGIVRQTEHDAEELIDALYAIPVPPARKMVVDTPCTMNDADGAIQDWRVYGIYFREGILIIHVPAEQVDTSVLEFISRRDIVVRNLLRKQLPVYTPLSMLVADLNDAVRIRDALPAEEYFELINEVWSTLTPIFRKYYGSYGKHVGDGICYFFLPQPDSNYISNAASCARALNYEIRVISKRWQLRKNWSAELSLNIALREGREWLGTLQSAAGAEFAALRDNLKPMTPVDDYNCPEALRAIKTLGSQLMAKERARTSGARAAADATCVVRSTEDYQWQHPDARARNAA